MNNGQDLISFINSNSGLKELPIEYTFMELLKQNIIKPSEIIDAYTRVLNNKCNKYRSHYEDSCVSALQLFEFKDNFKGDAYESARKRFLYNASFSESFPNMIGTELTAEERAEWRKNFKLIYGFDPEN
jgi:hypothetical protein